MIVPGLAISLFLDFFHFVPKLSDGINEIALGRKDYITKITMTQGSCSIKVSYIFLPKLHVGMLSSV